MADIDIGNSVKSNYKIWRFMPLDGFVNLLSSESLFFSPLSYYAESDPFEGYIPSVAFEALADVFGKELDDLENAYSQVVSLASPQGNTMLSDLRSRLDALKSFPRELFKQIVKRIVVNCWHINETESAAMWKIYSDVGKGIAIQTTIQSLRKALIEANDNFKIKIGVIKYLDFYDTELKPFECIVDGSFAPLLKRDSYSHERELRACIVPPLDYKNPASLKPKPITVKVAYRTLIERVYISPFANEPFASSVCAISSKFGLDIQIIKRSQLLDGAEGLVNLLDMANRI